MGNTDHDGAIVVRNSKFVLRSHNEIGLLKRWSLKVSCFKPTVFCS
jgi:hypothetical protein